MHRLLATNSLCILLRAHHAAKPAHLPSHPQSLAGGADGQQQSLLKMRQRRCNTLYSSMFNIDMLIHGSVSSGDTQMEMLGWEESVGVPAGQNG